MKKGLPCKKEEGASFKRVASVILGVALLFFAFTFGYFFSRWTRGDLHDILEIYDVVRENYVGETELDATAFAKFLNSSVFDRFSTYYTAEEYKKIQKQSEGGYSGFGVSLTPISGDSGYDAQHKFTVYKVYYNSPAYNAGIRARDNIVGYMDGETEVRFSNRNQLANCLGNLEDGVPITLIVYRNDPHTESTQYVTVAKGSYKRTYVLYADSEKKLVFKENEDGTDIVGEVSENDGSDGITGLDDRTAYIALSAFEGSAAREIRAVMKYMKTRSRNKLILDLSNNGGGYIDVLCEIASSFIYSSATSTPVVLYAKDKNGRMTHFSAKGDEFNRSIISMSVIANENTASAAESLLGAMLHYWGMRYSYDPVFNYDKLVLIKGTDGIARTYGKGVMQSSFSLSTGAVLKLTTATLTFPDMTTCINETGIRYPEWVEDTDVTDFTGALSTAISLL